jgi:pimeloyl-ACP methyl ester carboxylesterase
MAEVETKSLKVEGAEICFEVAGKGPYLLCVPGANCDAGIFKPLRALLTDYFTVALCDRRGFSCRRLTGTQPSGKYIDTDVIDILPCQSKKKLDKSD